MRRRALLTNKTLRAVTARAERLRWRCKVASCSFEVSAKYQEANGLMVITRSSLDHHCDALVVQAEARSSIPSPLYVGQINSFLLTQPDASIKDLQAVCRRDHLTPAPRKSTIGRIRKRCRLSPFGTAEMQFARFPELISEIQRLDPEATCSLDRQANRFQRIFWAPGLFANWFRTSRKLAALDGASIKGEHAGNLLLLASEDGDNKAVLLAAAIVTEPESADVWKWFLEHCKNHFPDIDSSDIGLVSDRDKGLSAAFPQVFTRATHLYCAKHLLRNMRAQKITEDEGPFWALIKQPSIFDFEKYLPTFIERCPDMWEYLGNVPLPYWTLAHSPVGRYGRTTNNYAEHLNNVFKTERRSSFIDLFQRIYIWVGTRRYHRSTELAARSTSGFELSSVAQETLDRRTEVSLANDPRPLTADEGYVLCSRTGREMRVRLDNRHCSCGTWRDDKIPCHHAISLASRLNVAIKTLVGPEYQTSEMALIHGGEFPAIDFQSLRISQETCLPPQATPQRGRPPHRRIRSRGETPSSSTRSGNMPRTDSPQPVRPIRCSLCHAIGHNSRTCPNRRLTHSSAI